MKNTTCNYEIVKETIDLLLIRDLGPHDKYMTITNAAEQVVTELAPRLGNRRLEYIDSEGERAQIIVREGKFAGFAPATAKDFYRQRDEQIVVLLGDKWLLTADVAKLLEIDSVSANSILTNMANKNLVEWQYARTGRKKLLWRAKKNALTRILKSTTPRLD